MPRNVSQSEQSSIYWAFYIVCVAVVYGSLFPFQFSLDIDKSSITTFLGSWKGVTSSGDVIGNIVLFLPMGLLGYFLPARSNRADSGPVFVLLVWVLIAGGCQITQLTISSRDATLFDLYGNALGAVLGWQLARFIPRSSLSPLWQINQSRLIPAVLIILWLVSQLIPFVPTIDLQSYKSAIKPLLLTPEWSWSQSVLEWACWVVFFYFVSDVSGHSIKLRALLLGSLAVLLLKIVIVMNHVTLTGVVALGGALFLYSQTRGKGAGYSFLPWFLLAAYTLNAAFPLTWHNTSTSFSWMPFSGFLQGSMLVNSIALCQKLFVFGAIAWLLVNAYVRVMGKFLLTAFSLLLIEIAQVKLFHGSPEITDPILFLVTALLVKRLSASAVSSVGVQEGMAQDPFIHSYFPKSRNGQLALIVGIYCLACIIFLNLLLQLPGVPYNVRELFRFHGNGVDLFFFGLSLISFGWGTAWFGKKMAMSTRIGFEAPVALFKLSIVVYFFVWMSVTRESIMDIAGSTVFVHRVVEKGVLGDIGAGLFLFLGRDNLLVLTDLLEPPIRFGALIGPVLIMMGVMFAVLFSRRGKTHVAHRGLNPSVKLALYLLPWLYLCKVVAFDWSSTDNLNELIARDGYWGLGGGGYLYALVFLISLSSTGLAWSIYHKHTRALRVVVVSVIAVPLGWFFLNQGLEENVGKYGLNFSGVDFLLGPDRENLMSRSALFGRWFVVQIAAVVGLAFGALLYMRWSCSSESNTSNERRVSVPHAVFSSKIQVESDGCQELGNQKEQEKLVPVENVQSQQDIHLRASQLVFLNYLASVWGVDASEVFTQLIDLAIMPEDQRVNSMLYKSAARSEVMLTHRNSKSRRWQQQTIFLDDSHIKCLDSLTAGSGKSRSATLRHLLKDFKLELAASHDNGIFSLLGATWRRMSGGKYGPIIPVSVVLVFIITALFLTLRKGASIEHRPYWGGERATVVMDLHTHTSYSDGVLTPTELVDVASSEGCDALVISDHSDVSRALGEDQMQEFRSLRLSYPKLLLFAGVELNMPSYGGREHVGLIAQPGVENRTLKNLRDIAEQTIAEEKDGGRSGNSDSSTLQMAVDFQSLWGGLLMVYNHPSRSDPNTYENTSDMIRWNAAAPFFSLMEGGPGHQNAPVAGGYSTPHLTIDGWDPAVAEVGGAWDELWSQGYQIWAAIASSAYHDEKLDKPPCAFSRTHLAVPEKSYRGVMNALKSGTFWADQGRILDQLWFTVGVEGLEQAVYPGSTVYSGGSNTALVSLSIERGPGSIGLPLVAEIIGNCKTGSTEVLAEFTLAAGSSTVSGDIPLRVTGRDHDSCFLRARVRKVDNLGADLLAYTNPVKLRM